MGKTTSIDEKVLMERGRSLNILIACEESQAVCTEMRRLGHRAFSCDIEPCSGGHPEWHIWGDCLPILDGNRKFITADGKVHEIGGRWDMIIAHPPCTFLTSTGNSWFNVSKYGDNAVERARERERAFEFFMLFVKADCDRIAIENPVGYVSTHYRKPDQIIQPYMFGDDARKATCLWLKNLPPLHSTNVIRPTIVRTGHSFDSPWHAYTWSISDKKERSKVRSKTFPGIARAMAEQWTRDIYEEISLI